MMRYVTGIICILMVAGCTVIPFHKTSLVPTDGIDPRGVIDKFRVSVPEHYQILHSLMFKYGWTKVTTLGYAEINGSSGSFTAVSMNPMGVKLFEISGNDEGVTKHFMMEELSRKGEFTNAIGEDIRRMYFDLLPASDAELKIKDRRILFRQVAGRGVLVYTFAGEGWHLVEKAYYRDNNLQWRVSYYEYRQKEGNIYPGGIILHNYQYGYSITVKVKEIQL